MRRPPRLGRRAVLGLLFGAVAGLAAVAVLLNAGGDGGGGGKALALPSLYRDADLRVVDALAAPAQARADRMAARWLARHPVRDDAAFMSYALTTVGPPPGAGGQRAELAELHRLGAHRTPAGVAASVWLERHGRKDVWKTFVKQYRQLAAPAAGARAKALYKQTYKLAVALQATGKDRFRRRSPYEVDPTLHAVNQTRFSGGVKYSYPSKHAIIGFAEAGVLGRLEPHRAGELRWMADEVAFSRLYAGGHYPSDVAAGIYLGRLLADYELGAR